MATVGGRAADALGHHLSRGEIGFWQQDCEQPAREPRRKVIFSGRAPDRAGGAA